MKIISKLGTMKLILLLAGVTLACAAPTQVKTFEASAPAVNSGDSSQKGSTKDGVVSVKFETVFKLGETKDSQIELGAVKEAPPFPTGYTVFQNMVYRIETEAIASGATETRFRVAAASAEEFKKLRVLHLKWDEMSLTSFSWKDATVLPGKWKKDEYPMIEKEKYDRLLPDPATKTIAATTDDLGVFVIALQPETPAPANKPFTPIGVMVTKSLEPVMVGDGFSYTITVTNQGPKSAGEVNLQKYLDGDADFLAARTTQGSCQRAARDSFLVNCHLGALPVGAAATITITARARNNRMMDTKQRERFSTIYVGFKERPSDLFDKTNTLTQRLPLVTMPRSQ